eukprot:scaffold1305_cov131-Skeletonema_marinoi.AAC.4
MNETTDDLLFVCVLVAIIRGWMVLKAAADDNITAAAVRNNLVAVILSIVVAAGVLLDVYCNVGSVGVQFHGHLLVEMEGAGGEARCDMSNSLSTVIILTLSFSSPSPNRKWEMGKRSK